MNNEELLLPALEQVVARRAASVYCVHCVCVSTYSMAFARTPLERSTTEFGCRRVLLRTASSRQSRVDQLDPNRLAAGAQPSTIDDRAAGELAKMLFAASSGMTRGGQI